MSVDLSKLLPARWEAKFDGQMWYLPGVITGCDELTAKAVAILRNALDIQMRRGWTAHKEEDGRFYVDAFRDGSIDPDDWTPGPFATYLDETRWADPATALCKAEAWFLANGGAP